jgi:hypothetical protein
MLWRCNGDGGVVVPTYSPHDAAQQASVLEIYGFGVNN